MPNSATASLPSSTPPGPAPAEQKKGGSALRLPQLDGVPVIAPIIMCLVVIIAATFDAIPKDISALSVGYVVTCIAVVLTMGLCGFFVRKAMGMYPIDASLVTRCQRTGRHGRRGYPVGREPNDADAVHAGLYADRWCRHGDHRSLLDSPGRLTGLYSQIND